MRRLPLPLRPLLPLVLLLLTVLPLTVAAQGLDTLWAARLARVADHRSPTAHPSLLLYDNPAMQPLHYGQSLSEIGFGYEHRHDDEPQWVEQGDGYRGGAFRAQSFTRMGPRAVVWGEAGYTTGRRLNQQWSENADFDIIQPYVTADSIGGDMECEQYSFRGGYAWQGDRWGYGAQMGYRSGMDYRDHDPRPKCTTLDVDLTTGVSRRLGDRYLVGAFAGVSKYNQQQSIVFMNPRGVSMVYQMTGLGTHYFRFKGDRTNTRYDGSSWTLGLSAAHTDSLGPLLAASTRKFHLQKQLSDEHYLPLCDIDEWHHQAELAWRQPHGYVRLAADVRHRTGTERIYDSGVTFYKQITEQKPLQTDGRLFMLEGATWQRPLRHVVTEVQPQVVYSSYKSTYATPSRESSYSHLAGILNLHVRWQHRTGLLSSRWYGGYRGRLAQRLLLSDRDDFAPPMSSVERNHQAQAASCLSLGASVRYDLPLLRFVSTLYVQSDALLLRYDTHQQSTHLSFSLGVTL